MYMADIAAFPKLRSLKWLSIKDNVQMLSLLSQLRRLELDYVGPLNMLLSLTNVEELKFCRWVPMAWSDACIFMLTKLQHPTIKCITGSARHITLLRSLTALRTLELYKAEPRGLYALYAMTNEDLACLCALSNLDTLCLNASDINDASLHMLAQSCCKLRRLRLSGSSNINGVGLYGLTRLTLLDLSECNVNDAGLRSIARWVSQNSWLQRFGVLGREYSLTSLDVSHCLQLTGHGLRSIALLTQLESLKLTGTAITDECIFVLTSLLRLRELRLGSTRVTCAGVQSLSCLYYLNLSALGVFE